jgi:hypothetical protein
MAGRLTVTTLNDDTGVLAVQNGMSGIAKAWVNFNGVSTASIRASFNVSSVTRNGTGDYTVNFTTAMPDGNYSANANCMDVASGTQNLHIYGSGATSGETYSTTQLRVGSGFDSLINCVQVFR